MKRTKSRMNCILVEKDRLILNAYDKKISSKHISNDISEMQQVMRNVSYTPFIYTNFIMS